MPSALWKPFCQTFLGEVSALSFDPYSDLLWTATSSGTVISHFLPTSFSSTQEDRRLDRYTSFKSHSYRSITTDLIISERGVLSLGDKSVKSTSRRGLPHWFSNTHFQDAHSMAFTAPKSIELVVGGSQPELVLINAGTGAPVRKLDISHGSSLQSTQHAPGFSPTTHLRRSQALICCGARSGTVTLRDPVSLKEEHSMMAHYAGLEQMETEGNYLVTCGFSLKQGHPVRDPLVKVFDIRALRPLAPITFPSIPALIRFHPRMPSTLFIASSSGQLQILDLANPLPSSSFYHLDVGTFITDMCISSSGEGLAYAEADGVVHLWTTLGEMEMSLSTEDGNGMKPIKWSRANLPIELPDPVNMPTQIDWSDETPLSSIGMPYYSTELLSVLPYETYITSYSPLYQPRPALDPDLALALYQRPSQHPSSKIINGVFDGGGNRLEKAQYLANPKRTKRYQASLPVHPASAFSGRAATARVGAPAHHAGPLAHDSKRRLSIPLFRSEREKEKAKSLSRGKSYRANTTGKAGGDEEEVEFDLSLEEFEEMPKWYRQVEIQYSKFGIEDFDFGFYNKTQYSGLETHIMNSYTNSLLQILYHTMPLRRVAESHIAMACMTLNCMLCELGFLFKMLDDAKGVNCQTSNFSKAFSINQRAIALELMDHQHQDFCLQQNPILQRPADQSGNSKLISISSKSYASLIQLCHHFLLDQIAEDASKVSSDQRSLRHHSINTQVKTTKTSTSVATISNHLLASPITDIYATKWQTNQLCPSCHHQTSRTTFTKVIEMTYPRKALSNEQKPMTDFCSILKNSMVRETTAKSLCAHCNQYTHQRWRREPDDEGIGNAALPSVLALNAGVTNSEQLEIWLDERAKTVQSTAARSASEERQSQRFLQPEIGVAIQGSATGSSVVVGDDHPVKAPEDSVRYELRGMIVQIQSDDETPHLVSLIKIIEEGVEESATRRSKSGPGWYLFNDFLVRKISEEEALSFPASWKIPCMLYYIRKDVDQVLDLSRLPLTIDKSILLKDINLSECRDVSKIRHEVLTEDELPKKGELVAIDAEFVSLQQEEVDYKSDGTRLVRRPSRMTLARVSVLRGEGSKTGVPFIDDHIQTFEAITDYLTEYSGIRPGDLDLHASPHTLVPLKVAYKKLRLLVDLGCIFIGHGLSKDFRIINIHVPPSQIIDTVDLYYIPSRQRKLSLRLLSFLILKHDIQNAGMHDSIEDARTALQLYDIYKQLNNEGVWKEELESVYRKGKEMGWKVPGSDKGRSPSVTPAACPAAASAPAGPPKPGPAPVVPRFTPSALSATSATYFPTGAGPSVSRALQPVRNHAHMLSGPADHSSNLSMVSAPFYGPMGRHAQVNSPPIGGFGATPLPPLLGHSPGPFSPTGLSPGAAATALLQRYNQPAQVAFNNEGSGVHKKQPTFNPMAPSFVQGAGVGGQGRTSGGGGGGGGGGTGGGPSGGLYAHHIHQQQQPAKSAQ